MSEWSILQDLFESMLHTGLPLSRRPYGRRLDFTALPTRGVQSSPHHPQHHAALYTVHQVQYCLCHHTLLHTISEVLLGARTTEEDNCALFDALPVILILVVFQRARCAEEWEGLRGVPTCRRSSANPQWSHYLLPATWLRAGPRGEAEATPFTHQTPGPLQRGGEFGVYVMLLFQITIYFYKIYIIRFVSKVFSDILLCAVLWSQSISKQLKIFVNFF